ncbi:AraC family transcriptional regulator [Amycolatopsis regifaucium]|uniref:AraC family transcriptional regulator n=1 Tax=Amycolatopsis regifaucium TaxID=546365 RepID=A0A154MFP4_9PSEU|nr:helix-turn-helix domain-containing protein [Amycolatopsis regifaucium]KZB83354.1 AraC family transcriptional regulator [Amycolatopsis regifaucium]OKA08820.1 AraC family transcriptional regulator [Amycolatopsis regifaucium]SFI93498.1 AraC-type DNA-binding protein [Amycolatopsis regifaucium]
MSGHRIPAGIVNAREASAKFSLVRHPPAPELRPFVDHHWVLRWDLTGREPHEQVVLPNLAVNVTFFRDAAGAFGPGKRPFRYLVGGVDQGIGVRFRPGAFRAFLTGPVKMISGGSVPLTDLFPAAGGVTESVRNATNDFEMVRVAEELLLAKHPVLTPAARTAIEAVETIAGDPAITRVGVLSSRTGLSQRSLQRLFAEHVGAAPKWAIQVYRLNEAAARIAAEERLDYAKLALTLGYSDQAHFIRDFRSVTGWAPTEYALLNRVQEQENRRE